MNLKLSSALCVGFIFCLATVTYAGQIVERIVATVNGQIILQSDWEDSMRYESFIAGRPLNEVSPANRKAALDRLIDQELLREQIRATEAHPPDEAEVQGQIDQLRKLYPQGKSDKAWRELLSVDGLNEAELRRRIALQLQLARFVDVRLRPQVTIDSRSIESYYSHELLPQLQQSGEKDVPLAAVRPKIKELLTQKKINQLLVAWLEDLRASGDVHTHISTLDGQDRAQ